MLRLWKDAQNFANLRKFSLREFLFAISVQLVMIMTFFKSNFLFSRRDYLQHVAI